MGRKTRVSTTQITDIKAITQWLMEHTQITGRQQAEGWAYLLVTDANFDRSRPCDLRVSQEEIQVPSVESLESAQKTPGEETL